MAKAQAPDIFSGNAMDIAQKLYESERGSHFLVLYHDLVTYREMYSHYIKATLDNNEIVLVLPFYETVDSVRQILSEDSACIDVRKKEKEQSLLIIDGLKGYFGLPNGLMSFTKQLVEYAKTSGKNCVSIIGDMGPFFYNRKKDNLIGWELELPYRYESSMKGFCVYHERDFDRRLLENDKELLFGHHEQVLDMTA
ncbi:MAG TPA: MEDS domain-containing protein [Nitrososphaeraceae archaeon]|nr:MEDS domain-containing protein [Nitrososphaeraceae archaeon]